MVRCEGISMQPALRDNEIVLCNMWKPIIGSVKRNDVVVLRSPSDPRQHLCKRITAIEGDKVKRGLIFPETVPKGHIWIEGDNKYYSKDSRTYGAVPMGLVVGVVIYRIYPFNKISAVK